MALGGNLGHIRSNFVKRVRKQALSVGFFLILHGEYFLKQELVAVQTPE